jgi:hypothetical protein
VLSQWEFIEKAAHSLGVAGETMRKSHVRGVLGCYRLPIVPLAARQNRQFDPKALMNRPAQAGRGYRPAGRNPLPRRPRVKMEAAK